MRKYHNKDMTMVESVAAEPPAGFRLCARFAELGIKLEQRTNRQARLRVTYGLQVNDDLMYAEACAMVGQALLHALACDGKLTNDGE